MPERRIGRVAATNDDSRYVSGVLTGHIDFWEITKGFGMIDVDPPSQFQRVHCAAAAVRRVCERDWLADGQLVKFRAKQFGQKWPTAWDLELIDGPPATTAHGEPRYTGLIKLYREAEGYGFLKSGSDEIHFSADQVTKAGRTRVEPGAVFTFRIRKLPTGKRTAVDLLPLSAGAVG